jgi:hypothetical protein
MDSIYLLDYPPTFEEAEFSFLVLLSRPITKLFSHIVLRNMGWAILVYIDARFCPRVDPPYCA